MATAGAMHMWLFMRVSVLMSVIVRMPVIMRMAVIMRMPVIMVTISGVRSVFTVRAVFRLKGFVNSHHRHVHVAKHVGQHMVGFDFQMIGLQLNRHMAVAQVVGGAGQIKQAAVVGTVRDTQYRLRRSQYLQQ